MKTSQSNFHKMLLLKIATIFILSSLNFKYVHSTEGNKLPRNCFDLYNMGVKETGVHVVYPYECFTNKPVKVFCDNEMDGCGWTVIQYRNNFTERENFTRKWIEYKLGFGSLTHEFWLGLDNIHALVSGTLMELRIDLEDYEGCVTWAKYEFFYICDECGNYKLDLGKYSGDAGDALSIHIGSMFSTYDCDHDSNKETNCAKKFKGGWWYASCHQANLNGFPYKGEHESYADGINWKPFHGYHYSLKMAKMSIRPKPMN